jgi:hypothetical protein
MKIAKVVFGKTIAMPGYNNDKPEVEAILEDNDILEDCLSALNKRLSDWHRKEYPHLYTESNHLPAPVSRTTPGPSVMGTTAIDKEEFDAGLANDIKALQKIQYKEDAEVFMNEQVWRKYNPVLKSIVNAKPLKIQQQNGQENH